MKRLAAVTPYYFGEDSRLGGAERYATNLARAVARTGSYEVELVSYGDGPDAELVPLPDEVTLRLLAPVTGRPGSERLSWGIIDALRDADVVHIHQVFTRSSEVAMLAAKVMGKPVCVTDHGGRTSELGQSLGILHLADRIVAYSEFGAAGLPAGGDLIEIVRGGVDDEFFTPGDPAPPREGVVFVGPLLPRKGIDRLLEALPPEVPLTICGRPEDPDYLELLRALAAGKQVEFRVDGSDADLRDLYRSAVAVVLPGVYVDRDGVTVPWPELMGFSLLEGMACGAPAICSRVGGMPEYVENGTTGFVFDEPAQLTGLIERLAVDRPLVASMGAAARETVVERFGMRPAGSAMRGLYDAVAAAPGPR